MSYRTSNTYETVYILKSGLPDSEAAAIHQKVDHVIEKFGGKVLHRDDWGLTQLAYPINDETMGRYTVAVYQGKSGVVEEIERHFKILGQVVRFITVQVEADYDYSKIKKQMSLAEEEMRKNREAKEQRKRAQQQAPAEA
ncbi:MAG: 30S ribosomal protein S6 [Proteobacteria bacterium]|nr:30S ribosomal protein S6 [Pseudomonadota bacterium]NDC23289.1 30S ribosomal protein S6 [Pseudomonadota bacterium]NDD03452.1 30S ribosomal protein S6 [Pseudomonadota bacterium]NDG25883.1 30S ribosomal protein S6 [Pseudomonadota bacterium]